MIGKYILAEKEMNAKIRAEVTTCSGTTDGIYKPSVVRFFINDKEIFCLALEYWDEDSDSDRYKACELLEAFGFSSKEAHAITYDQVAMDVKRTTEY